MSQSSVPLLHEVIPLIDILTAELQRFIDDTDALPAIRSAAMHGRAMLDKYYSKTDDSVMFRIAMSTCHSLFIYIAINVSS